MQFSLTRQQLLPHIPSGSILEYYNNHFFLVGDDANMLFILDENWELLEKRRIFESKYEGQRIPKKEKSDLEAGTICEFEGKKHFFVLGSGSKSPERDRAFLIPIEGGEVKNILLTPFYNELRKDKNVKELNIEAAFTIDNQVFLMNRGGLFQENLLIIPQENVWRENEICYKNLLLRLPNIKGVAAGVSGATYHEESQALWICASAEATTDAYNDGEIMGSLIGVIQNFPQKIQQNSLELDDYVIFPDTPPIKIESLCINKKGNIQSMEITTVADNDDGTSILTRGDILF